jgi:hypothetical protein
MAGIQIGATNPIDRRPLVETVATIRAVARMPVPITVFLAKRVTFLESKEVVS